MFETEDKYEFDAPQCYDFETRSTGTCHSEWFNEQTESCLPTPCREVNSGQRAGVEASGKSVTERTPQSKVKKPTSSVRRSFKLIQSSPSQSISKALLVRRSIKLALFQKHIPAKSLKLTIPTDIEFHTEKRLRNNAAAEPPSSPFKPLSVKVKEFESKLAKDGSPVSDSGKPLKVTEPKTPKLRTNARKRPSRFKSREDEELDELAQVPKFKALNYRPKSTSSGLLALTRLVEKPAYTEPAPFHFVTDDRASVRVRPASAAQGEGEKRIADGSFPKPKLAKIPRLGLSTTVPMSPKLATKARARPGDAAAKSATTGYESRLAKKFASLPGDLNVSNKQLSVTQPLPFSLRTEQRGKTHEASWVAKVRSEEEEAVRQRSRRAHGLPASTDVPIIPPKPQVRPLTLPQPFNLRSEVRHEGYVEELQKELHHQKIGQKTVAEFKARPMWRGHPFQVHEREFLLTVPEEPHFHTDERAVERGKFELVAEEHRREQEVEHKRRAEERRVEEEENRKMLRKLANFKATPMPDLSVPPPVVILEKPKLTQPISPKLGKSKRQARTAHF